MKHLIYLLGTFFFLFAFTPCPGQLQNAKFARLGVKEGLSQGTVFSLYQDGQGFMWIGTRDGLNRYNALDFAVYRNDPSDSSSLSDNFISALFEDSQHRFWVGTAAGLNQYDRSSGHFVRYPLRFLQSGNYSTEPMVYAIMEDHWHHIWFGTSRGLFRLAADGGTAIELMMDAATFGDPLLQKACSNIQNIYEDRAGHLWLGTTNGVLCLQANQRTGKPKPLRHFHKSHPHELNSNDVRFVYEMEDGHIWMGTKAGGINVYDPLSDSFSYLMNQPGKDSHSLASDDVRSILKDRFGGYWIGTLNGVNFYSPQSGFLTFRNIDHEHLSLSNNSIRPIFQDKRGSVWFGTYYGGISIFDRQIPKFNNYAFNSYVNSLSDNVVSGIIADRRQNLWIGTEGGGLNYFDRHSKRFTVFRHQPENPGSLSHNNVKSVHLDQHNQLWVGTYTGGLNVFNQYTGKFRHFINEANNPHSLPNNSVYAISEDWDGNLWFGTFGGGVSLLRKGRDNYFETYSVQKGGNYHLSNDLVRAALVDSSNNVWVGTEGGLNLKKTGEDHFSSWEYSIDRPDGISGNVITCIFEDRQHRIWVGTYKNGLNLYHPDKHNFSHYDVKQGLSGNNIFGIAEDRHGRLWLSTNNGLCCFDPDKGTVKSYNTLDGINGNEFSIGAYSHMADGEIFFGGTHGLTSFYPDSLFSSNYVPPTVFSGFRLFNKRIEAGKGSPFRQPIQATKSITLRYDQNIFTVEFAVLNYIFSNKNKYAYMLQGLENDWNYVQIPSATYTNLSPGTYTLLAKGANNDGLWNDRPARLVIHILPPPWRTWWAYMAYTMLAGAGIYLIIRYTRIRSKLEHELQLEQLKMERQKELSELKINFFTQISHELRTPLTLILSPMQRLLASKDARDEKEREILVTVQQNANRLLQLVNQLLDFRKQESGTLRLQTAPHNLNVFIKQVTEGFNFLAAEKHIRFESALPTSALYVWFDPDLMQKVVSNLLSNAFKFTPKYGEIKIRLSEEAPVSNYPQGFVRLEVWDNGQGIPAGKLEEVFEWYYQLQPTQGQGMQVGTGIGLALAKKLVELHGGRVYADSNLGLGASVYTRFIIELPLGKEHLSPEQLLADPLKFTNSSIQEVAGLQVHKPSILIAEDNDSIRQEIIHCLGDQYSIYEAADGMEAWELIQVHIPDLVITDVMMPGRDGIALLKLIKQDIRSNHIPVLLLTARTSESDMLQALEAGCDDYLSKPFHAHVLSLKVFNMFETRERFRRIFTRQFLLVRQSEEPVSPSADFLGRIAAVVEDQMERSDFHVNILAQELGVSRPVLYRKVKQLTGLNLIELINAIRLRRAAQLLLQDGLSVSEVAYRVGFSDPKYFGKSFKSQYGKSPKEYIAAGGGESHMAAILPGM